MRSPSPWLLVAPLLLAGCVSPAALDVQSDAGDVLDVPPLGFTDPVKLTQGGYGYEPSIEVGPDGTLYATAHKASLTHEGTRLASWLWYSRDNGTTWKEMPSPAQHHDKLFAFEGDLAVDAKGRIYFVDTYLFDNTISRWSTTPDGPKWDFTRPVHATAGIDDRPWLAAHGDGIVYYLGNNGLALPGPNGLLAGKVEPARMWLYTSTDGGASWSLGHGFPGSSWCGLAASPADDVTVFVGCTMGDGRAVVYTSGDRGKTFTPVEVGECEGACGPIFPSMTADAAGNPYFAWISTARGKGSTIQLAREVAAGEWTTTDVTPFEGSFGMVWIAGGAPGQATVTFYGTNDTKLGGGTEWHAYALLLRAADTPAPVRTLARIDPEPVGKGAFPPGDFFQNVVGPDGATHVAYQRMQPNPPGYIVAADILHVRQVLAPPEG